MIKRYLVSKNVIELLLHFAQVPGHAKDLTCRHKLVETSAKALRVGRGLSRIRVMLSQVVDAVDPRVLRVVHNLAEYFVVSREK